MEHWGLNPKKFTCESKAFAGFSPNTIKTVWFAGFLPNTTKSLAVCFTGAHQTGRLQKPYNWAVHIIGHCRCHHKERSMGVQPIH